MTIDRESLKQKGADLYQAGKSLSEVSSEIGIPTATVHRWIKQAGIKAHDPGSWHLGRQWTEARRVHTPEREKIERPGPRGYDLLAARAMGNKGISSQGYVRVQIGRKLRQYEHVLIAEKVLGRRLKAGEVVHHINCIRHDNRPENLLVCTRSYHQQLHAKMRSDPYWSEVERQAKTINHE